MTDGRMLDCVTPRGQAFVVEQRAIAERLARVRGLDVVHLASAGAAPIDALFHRAQRLCAIGEVKARAMSYAGLVDFGSYLVTFDKLCHGRDLAARLEVEYVLVVGLLDAVVWWNVSDKRGRWLVEFVTRATETQATCNGGIAVRMNAYLSLDRMHCEPD